MHPAAEHPGLCAGAPVPLQHLVAGVALCCGHGGCVLCRDRLPPQRLLQGTLESSFLPLFRMSQSHITTLVPRHHSIAAQHDYRGRAMQNASMHVAFCCSRSRQQRQPSHKCKVWSIARRGSSWPSILNRPILGCPWRFANLYTSLGPHFPSVTSLHGCSLSAWNLEPISHSCTGGPLQCQGPTLVTF